MTHCVRGYTRRRQERAGMRSRTGTRCLPRFERSGSSRVRVTRRQLWKEYRDEAKAQADRSDGIENPPSIAGICLVGRRRTAVGMLAGLARPSCGHCVDSNFGEIKQLSALLRNPTEFPMLFHLQFKPADRVGEACSAMRGHRANASTHTVGRRAPPFGSRPGIRPRRRGPQPYSLIRFSTRSWRIERLGATQAVTLVRKAG